MNRHGQAAKAYMFYENYESTDINYQWIASYVHGRIEDHCNRFSLRFSKCVEMRSDMIETSYYFIQKG